MNKMKYSAAIFDFDGTLVDDINVFNKMLENFHKKYNINLSKEEYYKLWSQGNSIVAKTYLDLSPSLKSKFNLDSLIKYLNEDLSKNSTLESKPFEGIIEFLNYLYENNIKMGIASSNNKNIIKLYLEKYNLKKYFSCIVTVDEVANPKPSPDVFTKCAEFLGVKCSDVVIFEDLLKNLNEAVKKGFFGVFINYENKEIESNPSLISIINYFDSKLKNLF